MRCLSCDCELTDFEATRRYSHSGEFVDLCGRCIAPIVVSLDTSERFELFDPDLDSVDQTTPPDDIEITPFNEDIDDDDASTPDL